MIFLLDTHLLLWASGWPETDSGDDRMPTEAARLIDDRDNELLFSVASIWETAIKHGLGRADFTADPRLLRRGLLDSGYRELPITGPHAAAIMDLPPLHKDPFDRMLIAQARVEGVTLLTADRALTQYSGSIRCVRR